jgi:hypothetical protein
MTQIAPVVTVIAGKDKEAPIQLAVLADHLVDAVDQVIHTPQRPQPPPPHVVRVLLRVVVHLRVRRQELVLACVPGVPTRRSWRLQIRVQVCILRCWIGRPVWSRSVKHHEGWWLVSK